MLLFFLVIVLFKTLNIIIGNDISFIYSYERQKRNVYRPSLFKWNFRDTINKWKNNNKMLNWKKKFNLANWRKKNSSTLNKEPSMPQITKVSSNLNLNKKRNSIIYYVDSKLRVENIQTALSRIEKETCLKFTRTKDSKKTEIKYLPGRYFETIFEKNLDNPFKIYVPSNSQHIGKIIRETMHALGVEYEHNRSDRNNFISVIKRNILANYRKYFEMVKEKFNKKYSIPYDVRSIMHFASYEFAKGKHKVLNCKDKLMKESMGKSNYLTFNDARQLNEMYCSNPKIQYQSCYFHGYQNPKFPNKCKCLPFLSGNRCETFISNSKRCTKHNVHFMNRRVEVYDFIMGPNCSFIIRGTPSKRIAVDIKFTDMKFKYTSLCSEANSIEVKYKNDLSISGALVCPNEKNFRVVSQNNTIVIVGSNYKHETELSVVAIEV
ncbi:Astacin-like metalloendopeptidase [Strongyloides ratti]|uniref:Metalloendopeptidase n=1 Tax=Strongyloides ratti TaxID=34506 RepID=A0A090LKC7_STRRB|nr:Astacin-like metalloendopeptidase [Strongyloides ratti]CEF68603.1 Astacin-like metalloendopeptidase [Strongyloides ratti]